jgi:hypothetical protein
MKSPKVKMMPVLENGQHVWVVVKGGETKYAWPRNGKSSIEVAHEMVANWK